MRHWRHWHEPGFWRWWWDTGGSREAKLGFAVLGSAAVLAAGLGLAFWTTPEPQTTVVTLTEQVITAVETPGQTVTTLKPVTVLRTVRLPGRTKTLPGEVVTVRREGKTVVIRKPGRVVTVPGPVRVQRSVVFKPILRTRTQRVTVTSPAITLPGETVSRTVTEPGRTTTQEQERLVVQTITVERPTTVTDTRTVTQTETLTQTVTHTETLTQTVTVTEPPPAP